MSKVGIIANPEAGKDVRRLATFASLTSNFVKVDVLKRLIIGLDNVGVQEVLMMPDIHGLSEGAIEALKGKVSLKMRLLDMVCMGTVFDTIRAASEMEKLGVRVIVSLGGDGTLRAVFKGSRKIPLLGISLGTNNVLGTSYDSTIAGLIAGSIATNLIDQNSAVDNMKVLKLYVNGEEKDIALIDMALFEKGFPGAKAIWDVSNLKYAFFTKGEPTDIGLASIVGFVMPTTFTDDHGLFFEFGNGNLSIRAVIAPGLIKQLNVRRYSILDLGSKITLPRGWYTIAFDGEREFITSKEDDIVVELTREGPPLINPHRALIEIVKKSIFMEEY